MLKTEISRETSKTKFLLGNKTLSFLRDEQKKDLSNKSFLWASREKRMHVWKTSGNIRNHLT